MQNAQIVRNPGQPPHFMSVEPTGTSAMAYFGNRVLAKSHNALRVRETGNRVYPIRLCFPPDALLLPLQKLLRQSHCPLKGDADYFAFEGTEVGWACRALPLAASLDGHYCCADDTVRVVLEK